MHGVTPIMWNNYTVVIIPFYSLFCCVDESISQQTGQYYDDCAMADPSPNALLDSDSKRLWELGAEISRTSHLDVLAKNTLNVTL